MPMIIKKRMDCLVSEKTLYNTHFVSSVRMFVLSDSLIFMNDAYELNSSSGLVVVAKFDR